MDSDIPQPVNTEYEIELTPLALEMLANVKDQRHQKSLSDRIDKLKADPQKQGKPLVEKLRDFQEINYSNKRTTPDTENAERRNRESFCVNFGTFFYLEVP